MSSLAASGFITLVVDGRGTGFRGRAYRSIVTERLGYYEALDQIAAAK
jgi:dipeptidyl aminopeptidase